jgi:outer membrane protein OmpA-like peptidoglycan-associated protein
VDARATAGIKKAQDSADAAIQVATQAGDQAKKANDTAVAASGHVDTLNTTVNGLDAYKPISDVEVPFRRGNPMLSKDAKAKLDDMAKSLEGHQGYIIEIEARSPAAGSAGISSSAREAEAVQRYLVTEHNIPIYRMHAVALGNAPIAEQNTEVASNAGADQNAPKPAATHHRERVPSTVHIKLMENSLAAQGTTSPHGMASSTGAEQQ